MASINHQMLLADGVANEQPSAIQRGAFSGLSARATSSSPTWSATQAGNLLVLEFLCETNGASPTTPAGWSLWPAGNVSDGAPNYTLSVFYKIAAGGETGVTISHGSNQTGWIFSEFYAPKQTIDFATPVLANTLTPNPPAITPAGGAGNYAIVAGSYWFVSSPAMVFSAYSAGYANGVNGVNGGTNSAGLASAQKLLAGGTTDDPGVLTFTGTSHRTIAYTYAVS